MKKYKKVVVFFAFLYSITTFAQESFEVTVLRSNCEAIVDWINKHEINRIVDSLFSVSLDYQTDELRIDTIRCLTDSQKIMIQGLSKEELILILGADSFPFKSSDTTFAIVDTIGFFSDTYNYKLDNFSFQVIKELNDSTMQEKNIDRIFFLRIGIYNNEFVSMLELERSIFTRKVIICYFEISNDNTLFFRKSHFTQPNLH